LAFFLNTNVMIKSFQNLSLFWVKNANFFAKFFGENIFKIITSVPGVRKSSHRSDSLRGDKIGWIFAYWAIVFLGQLFEKYRSSLIAILFFLFLFLLRYFTPRKELRYNFGKKWCHPWDSLLHTIPT
jgi:hypothetical protein